MERVAKVSPFRLSSLLRQEKNPSLALQLFLNPNPQAKTRPSFFVKGNRPSSNKPFRHSAQSYDIITCKLAGSRMFTEMEQVLAQMAKQTRFTPKEALFCRIISLYGRARMTDAALRTFHRIPSFLCHRTIRSFNTLLDVLLRNNEIGKLQNLCRELNTADYSPDACTYNILIRTRADSGSIHGAFELFDKMRKEGIWPTAATFGTIISALTMASQNDEAFRLKEQMLPLYGIKPNVYVYTSLIKALCKEDELDRAIRLKDEMASDPEIGLDAAVYTTLIRAFFRAGRKGEVVQVLEEMKEKGVKPDTATFNAIIAGFCEGSDFEASLEVLREMNRRDCEPDVVSYNTIVMAMCRGGRWRDAQELFEDMPRRGCRADVVTYRMLLDGMCEAGEWQELARLLEEMVFNGYYPAAMSFQKMVEGVLEERWSLRLPELVDSVSAVK